MSAGPGFAPPQGAHRVPLQAVPGGGLPTRQRRPAMVAVAVLLIVAGALGALELVSLGHKKIVALVLVKPVPAGHVIAASDLQSTAITGKIAYWPTSDESAVIGKTAARDLFAGQLLTKSMMATASVPDADHALVGLQLKAGQVPSAGVADGDAVELVFVPGSNTVLPTAAAKTQTQASAGPSSTSPLVLATGSVYSVTASTTSSGSVLVTVLVPRTGSEVLSADASNGQVALIRVGG